MSISHIENYPTQPPEDAVETVDPADDLAPDPGTGQVDHDESDYYGRARRHVDPLGTALERLGVGRSREMDRHGGYEGLMTGREGAPDPDAPFRARDAGRLTTGTEQRSDRWVHDEALQVRQLLANRFIVTRIPFPAGAAGQVPQQIAPERPERISVQIQILGAGAVTALPCFIGPSGPSVAASGYPLFSSDQNGNQMPPNVFYMTSELWMIAAGDAAATVIHVLETLRSDSDAS